MDEFKPTHKIITAGRKIPVMECDGALYTEIEWMRGAESDWALDRDGTLLFQGVPNYSYPTTIKRLAARTEGS